MKSFKLVGISLVLSTLVAGQALAMEQIIRPFQSVRGAGMGGVKVTTGFYEENFYGNPARVTANPKFRFTLFDPSFEVNGTSISTVGDMAGEGDTLQKIGNTAGSNNHARFQLTTPSLYFPVPENGKMAFAGGIVNSVLLDENLRRSYQINPQTYVDSALIITAGRRFLPNDALSVGINARVAARANLKDTYTFAEFLRNSSVGFNDIGGAGYMVNFDVGGTYKLPMTWEDFGFQGGLVLSNALGGKYTKAGDLKTGPSDQPRTLGFGISARRPTVWKFTDFVAALEMTDIGNSNGGSFWRLIHIGGEVRHGIFAPRLGINQGYLCVGLGVLMRFFSVEYAYYGEEMGLNPGTFSDYRHALKLSLQI